MYMCLCGCIQIFTYFSLCFYVSTVLSRLFFFCLFLCIHFFLFLFFCFCFSVYSVERGRDRKGREKGERILVGHGTCFAAFLVALCLEGCKRLWISRYSSETTVDRYSQYCANLPFFHVCFRFCYHLFVPFSLPSHVTRKHKQVTRVTTQKRTGARARLVIAGHFLHRWETFARVQQNEHVSCSK